MIYITGDTHGNMSRIQYFCSRLQTKLSDILIILGDAGINYYGPESRKDRKIKEELKSLPITLFCIHGNHEMRPQTIDSYKLRTFKGGKVWVEDEYSNIIFAKDGEFYNFKENGVNYKTLVIGGAYSVDKYYRLSRGYNWFEDEQPSKQIKERVEQQIKKNGYSVDVVLTHTCPLKYEPREWFLPMINQNSVDKSTEEWLDKIEENLEYKKWYCGHYHGEKKIDKLEFLFESIIEFM